MQENKEQVNEIPIEEFDNDNQNIHEEFLEKFGNKKEQVQKSIEEDIYNDYKNWSQNLYK